MNLYLDISKSIDFNKAGPGGGAAVGRDSDKPGRQVAREYNESFDQSPVGVMGGDGPADDPDVGPRHRHSEEDSLDAELEDDRQADNKLAAERHLVRPIKDDEEEEEEEETTKAIGTVALDIAKSLNYRMDQALDHNRLNPVEEQFLLEELGYSKRDIAKGDARISGPDRHKFSEWLTDRMQKSISSLKGEEL